MPLVVRGLNLDGTCAHFTIGKTEIPYSEIGYGDNTEIEWTYVAGVQVPKYRTPGTYKVEAGSLKLPSIEARTKLFTRLPRQGASGAIMIAAVHYAHPQIGYDFDTLEDFSILGAKASAKGGSAEGLGLEFVVSYRLVKWTSLGVCFGNVKGTGPVGHHRF